MRPSRTVAVFTALLAVVACSRDEGQPPTPVDASPVAETSPGLTADYDCSGGQTVKAVYRAAEDVAEVTYKGRTHVMRTVVSASGARYAGDGMEWWTVSRDGRETATLSQLGPEGDEAVALLERCTARAAVQAAEAAAPACRGPQLELRLASQDAGAGNRAATIGAKNLGSRACTLSGYPGVTLADAEGAPLTGVRADNQPGSYFQPGATPGPVTVEPWAEAFFDIAWNVVPHEDMGETTCPQAAGLRATAPGDTAAIRLDLAMQPCGGRIRVSPFRPVAESSPSD